MTVFSEISLEFSAWLRKRQFQKFLPSLVEMLSPEKQDIILDVGAGTGVIANEVSKRCDEVFALEPDPRRVEFIKKRYPQIKAFDGTAEAIQFPEFYFTKVYTVSAFHHFKDGDTALYEFFRVLKHGGFLIIKDAEPEIRRSRFESRASGVKFLSSDKLKEMVERAGFQLKDFKKTGGDYFISSTKS